MKGFVSSSAVLPGAQGTKKGLPTVLDALKGAPCVIRSLPERRLPLEDKAPSQESFAEMQGRTGNIQLHVENRSGSGMGQERVTSVACAGKTELYFLHREGRADRKIGVRASCTCRSVI